MKSFKLTDCYIQGVTILAALVMALGADDILDEMFLGGYFVVGSWQVISAIVHFFYKPPYKILARKIYLYLLLALIVFALVCLAAPDAVMIFLIVLLCFSPFMAVYYLIVCISETQKLRAMEEVPVATAGEESL